jgi:hypothetical protein
MSIKKKKIIKVNRMSENEIVTRMDKMKDHRSCSHYLHLRKRLSELS